MTYCIPFWRSDLACEMSLNLANLAHNTLKIDLYKLRALKTVQALGTRVVSPITLRVKGKLTSFGGCVHFGSPEMLDSKAKHADLGKKLFSTFNLHWHLKFSQENKTNYRSVHLSNECQADWVTVSLASDVVLSNLDE